MTWKEEPSYEWGDGGAFSFGQNSYGELGHGDENDQAAPKRIEFEPSADVIDVACGNEQTTFLTVDGHVYACGYNDSGQCGVEAVDRILRPTLIASLSEKKVTRVFSGNGSEHVAVLTESGALYTFGFNGRGQLGLGSTTPSIAQPTLVQELVGKRVVEVACSYFHTAVVTADGELFACGRNDFGQLGIGDGVDRSVPTLVSSLRGLHINAVSCGQHHTVVAISSGGLFAFGKNDHGQLGLGESSTPVVEPTPVAGALRTASVTSLACGYYHTVAVTESGAVFSFGRNDYGQLGLGHKRHVATPTAVTALARVDIVEVACGCYHTLARSEDGKVYPFGRNNHGQLGLETSVDCVTAQIIPALRSRVVTKVAAGFYHSVCLVRRPSALSTASQRGSSLAFDMRRLLNNPLRSDVTFLVEGSRLHAHSCVLMARCEPLEKMLDGRTMDSSLSEINIPGCSSEGFKALLEFLYSDDVQAAHAETVNVELILELAQLADQYLVDGLRTLCETTLVQSFSVENVSTVYQSAHFHDAFRLKRKCIAYMLDHFSEVIATQSFVGLPPQPLQEVLLLAARSGVTIPNQNRLTEVLEEEGY